MHINLFRVVNLSALFIGNEIKLMTGFEYMLIILLNNRVMTCH